MKLFMTKITSTILFTYLALNSISAFAGIVWDNGESDPKNTGASFSQRNYNVADDFLLNNDEVLRSVKFWGTHWSNGHAPVVENFTANIYHDDSGKVDVLVGTSELKLFERNDTGFDHNFNHGANILEFTMDFINPINLTTGRYWLSLVSADNPGTLFLWQENNNIGNKQFSADNGNSWGLAGSEVAFSLSNEFNFPLVPILPMVQPFIKPITFSQFSSPHDSPKEVAEPNIMFFLLYRQKIN